MQPISTKRSRLLATAILAAAMQLGPHGCAPRNPFAAESWKAVAWEFAEFAGELTLAAENGGLFYAHDTLAYPAEPVDLIARVAAM